MNRRCVCVCMTAVLSILAFAGSNAAGTISKSRFQKTSVRQRESGTSKARRARNCSPCSEKLARSRRGRSTRKIAKSAKELPCHPKVYVDPKIARNYKAALRDLKRAGIKPQITSVWRSSDSQAQLRRCSLSSRCRRANPGLYRALPAGKSMHEAGFAVDMAGIAAGPRGNKQLTPKGRRIVAIMKKNGFKWRYGLSDPAHFEADPRRYGYRSAQQAITKTQTTCQVKFAKNKIQKKAPTRIAVNRVNKRAGAQLTNLSTSPRTRRNFVRARA
jgi:hypothetical protein